MLPFLAAGTALGLYTDGLSRFAGGMLFGAGAAMFMWARDSPPQYVENWATGAAGERKTARALRPLEDEGWVIRHDLPGRRGNIDHVAIGPFGIFLLDSKALSGELEARGDRLVAKRLGIDALGYSRRTGPAIAGLAQDLWIDLGGVRAEIPRVRAVVVVWGKLANSTTQSRYAVVGGPDVRAWLQAGSPTLAPSEIARIAERLDRLSAERIGTAAA